MSFRISNVQNMTSVARSFNTSLARSPPPYMPKFWISDWIELLLKKIVENKIGPTETTRWLFVLSSIIYNSYQFITKNKIPFDNEYWTSKEKGILKNDMNYLQCWIELSCQYAVPKLIKNYMNLSLSDDDIIEFISFHTPIVNINMQSFNKLKGLIDIYLQNRDNDGWKLTKTFDGVLPNGSSVIIADNNVDQNLNLLNEPNKWTPLQFGITKRNYLTPEWGTKNKGILEEKEFQELLDNTNLLFPSNDQYEKEMKEVEKLTSELTNEQKVIAEFWAGGPGTVTPPGMWVVFLDIFLRSNSCDLLKEIKTYTLLCSVLYQSSICAWRLKRDHMQARPVQKIRQYEHGKEINQAWNSKTLGQYWLPYQELNFVTPPFPDFVSGHSTFSSASSKIFCYLFETDTINLANPAINNPILQKLCPILTNTLNFSLNNIFIMPHKSTIEDDIPSTSINLSWNTWSDMARSSGKSRIYGGIHVESSNQAGQILGSNIADKIWNNFKTI
jgi:hypothetical protein